jgi:hypothetical protein
VEITDNLFATGQTALYLVLLGKRTVVAGEVEDGIYVVEKLLGLFRSDFGFGLGCGGFIATWLIGSRLIGI